MSLARFIATALLAGTVGFAGRPIVAPDPNAALAKANADRAMLEQINEANLKAIEAVRADLERQAKIASQAQAVANKRAAELASTKKRIRNAPKSFDGPVAPVLRRELDELRTDSVRPVVDGDAPTDPTGSSGADPDQPGQPDLPAPSPTS